jgi:hypothetical protein
LQGNGTKALHVKWHQGRDEQQQQQRRRRQRQQEQRLSVRGSGENGINGLQNQKSVFKKLHNGPVPRLIGKTTHAPERHRA